MLPKKKYCFLQMIYILYVYSNIQVCFYDYRSMMRSFVKVSLSGSCAPIIILVQSRGVSYWNAQKVRLTPLTFLSF